MKRDNRWLFPAAAVVVLLAAAVIGYLAGTSSDPAPRRTETAQVQAADLETDDEAWEGTVEYNGQTYVRNRDIKTVLFLGIDDKDAGNDLIGRGGRSDCIILVMLNKAEKTARMLEISRDTMTDVDVYDNNGDYVMTTNIQIAMQYAYGDSRSKSCRLTKNKVSQLLYGLNIDYVCSLTMDGIAVLVDGIGGVDITMPADYTDIDPAYVEGASFHMDGEEAYRFVHSRDLVHSGGNDNRMERQNWFLLEVVRQLKNNRQLSNSQLVEMADPYLETDMDADTLDLLRSSSLNSDSVKVPGTTQMGELHDEYHVDNAALQALLIQLFYLPK